MAIKKEAPKETSWWLAKTKENQHEKVFCRYFGSLICFVMPHAVIKFGLMMFCELIYHFIKTIVICLSAMALSYCVMYVTGNFY